MYLIILFFLMLFFLFGVFLLTALSTALRRLHMSDSNKQFQSVRRFFWYRSFHLIFFPGQEFDGLYFATICAQNIARFGYALFVYMFLSNTALFQEASLSHDFSSFWIVTALLGFIVLGFVVGDFLPRIFGTKMPEAAVHLCAPPASLYMFFSFPLVLVFLKLSQSLSRTIYFDHFQEPTSQAKQEIIQIIQNAELSSGISFHDKRLIESVLSFRDRIVREVMVPRINTFSLPAEISIKDVAQKIYEEGYSRIPIYKGSVDSIVGILMYKDVLKKYMESVEAGDAKILDASIESICKPILYTPETKKISNLLQEFRKQQVHLAVVVDEYGGTEGLVTIEDILEAIVGDIADEYDEEEEQLIKEAGDHSWIVDAKLNILDAEEQLGIRIPQDGDYDTVGGYIYHCAGAIPTKGFTIHHDTFEMEIMSSNERSVEKVRIRPVNHQENSL